MSNKRSLNKLLYVWIAISSALIIAGIVLLGLLDFNYQAEVLKSQTIEVEYGVVTQNGAKDDLYKACEGAIKSAGLKYNRTDMSKLDEDEFGETLVVKVIYTLSSKVGAEKLASVKQSVEKAVEELAKNDPDILVYSNEYTVKQGVYFDAYWRGGLAVGVGAIVALAYIAIRFGIGNALTGLTVAAHDSLLTVALLTITRIPVYFYSPLVYAATAAFVSIVLWAIQCMKMKENFKKPEYAALSSDEAVDASRRTSWKLTVIFDAALAAIAVVTGAIATVGSRGFFFPAILPIALPLYSSLVFGPALHVHVKEAFDKWKQKHSKNKKKTVRTVGTES